MASELADATSTEVVVRAPQRGALSPDAIRDAFTRDPAYDIIDYTVEIKGFFWPRVKAIRLIVTAKVDNVDGTLEP